MRYAIHMHVHRTCWYHRLSTEVVSPTKGREMQPSFDWSPPTSAETTISNLYCRCADYQTECITSAWLIVVAVVYHSAWLIVVAVVYHKCMVNCSSSSVSQCMVNCSSSSHSQTACITVHG